MRQIWAATCLTTFLLVGLANADDQAHKGEAAKVKAEVLEEKASAEGSKTLPTPTEIITKPQAQSPVGTRRLGLLSAALQPADDDPPDRYR
jgi:hypothetical protein